MASRFLFAFKSVWICFIAGCYEKTLKLRVMFFPWPYREIFRCQNLDADNNLHISCICDINTVLPVTKESVCDLSKKKSPEKNP